MSETVKYVLDESKLPEAWYNLAADLPEPPPPVLHPGTGQPVGPDDLAPLFPMAIIGQEVSTERHIAIPEEVRDVYRQWRPTPLYRARRLEQALETPARIYYKYEGVSPTGSHKPNTAIAQAFYNKQEGVSRLTTETGAGQWGSSLAFAARIFGLEVEVYMVRVSYEQKPYRRALMETFGARCIPSPSEETNSGRAILAEHPDSSGSLGIAISEAVEMAATREDTKYSLGSVLNHVLMHQTVIGEETRDQLELADDYPDIVIGCTGGGSNFSGLSFPFIGQALRDGKQLRAIAVEPAACPSLTKGLYAYDFGDTGHLTPLVRMHTLGSAFIPPPFHSGGLRYHGMAPMVSHLKELGLIEARAYSQTEVFAAGVEFARIEGIVPAPEANHAVKAAIDEAVRCRDEGVSEAILFNLCGHGHFDMQAYTDYFAGKLEDHEYSEDEVAMALAGLPLRRRLMEAAEERKYAASLFNRTWDLLELSERTPEQIDEMIHIAHASCYHWGQVGAPANGARGEWQCARVYATLGHAEPALWHARRCLEIVEAGGEGLEDWDLPSAQQALAHAHLAAGDLNEARRRAGLATESAARIEDPEDRELIESQIAELDL